MTEPDGIGRFRSTSAIVMISAVAALGAGALTASLWLGFMALVFRGADEVDGVGVAALFVLGLGITLVAMLGVYIGFGVWLIRRRPPARGRAVPTATLLAVPVLASIIAVLLLVA